MKKDSIKYFKNKRIINLSCWSLGALLSLGLIITLAVIIYKIDKPWEWVLYIIGIPFLSVIFICSIVALVYIGIKMRLRFFEIEGHIVKYYFGYKSVYVFLDDQLVDHKEGTWDLEMDTIIENKPLILQFSKSCIPTVSLNGEAIDIPKPQPLK